MPRPRSTGPTRTGAAKVGYAISPTKGSLSVVQCRVHRLPRTAFGLHGYLACLTAAVLRETPQSAESQALALSANGLVISFGPPPSAHAACQPLWLIQVTDRSFLSPSDELKPHLAFRSDPRFCNSSTTTRAAWKKGQLTEMACLMRVHLLAFANGRRTVQY